MARPERFELPTTWFVARYSIQLSYGRAGVRTIWGVPVTVNTGDWTPENPAVIGLALAILVVSLRWAVYQLELITIPVAVMTMSP
jgi:hypothetical protein